MDLVMSDTSNSSDIRKPRQIIPATDLIIPDTSNSSDIRILVTDLMIPDTSNSSDIRKPR